MPLIIFIFYVDNVKQPEHLMEQKQVHVFRQTGKDIADTIRLTTNPLMVLIIPMTIQYGLDASFITCDATKSWISCVFGLAMVTLMSLPYDVCGTIACFTAGELANICGHSQVMISEFLLMLGCQVFLFLWPVSSDAHIANYIIFGIWSAASSSTWMVYYVLYGIWFDHTLC